MCGEVAFRTVGNLSDPDIKCHTGFGTGYLQACLRGTSWFSYFSKKAGQKDYSIIKLNEANC